MHKVESRSYESLKVGGLGIEWRVRYACRVGMHACMQTASMKHRASTSPRAASRVATRRWETKSEQHGEKRKHAYQQSQQSRHIQPAGDTAKTYRLAPRFWRLDMLAGGRSCRQARLD
jgi:hypothetical protein